YTCLQCAEAWCMQACPVNAIGIDPITGAKIVLDKACVGCHLCTIACPFGTVFTLPGTDKASKCNLCGGQPACATACPRGAVVAVEGDGAGSWFAPWGEKVDRRYREAVPASPQPFGLRWSRSRLRRPEDFRINAPCATRRDRSNPRRL